MNRQVESYRKFCPSCRIVPPVELLSLDCHKQVVSRPTEHIQQLLGINAQGATG